MSRVACAPTDAFENQPSCKPMARANFTIRRVIPLSYAYIDPMGHGSRSRIIPHFVAQISICVADIIKSLMAAVFPVSWTRALIWNTPHRPASTLEVCRVTCARHSELSCSKHSAENHSYARTDQKLRSRGQEIVDHIPRQQSESVPFVMDAGEFKKRKAMNWSIVLTSGSSLWSVLE